MPSVPTILCSYIFNLLSPPSFFYQHLSPDLQVRIWVHSGPLALFLCHAQLENPPLESASFRSELENVKCDWREMATGANLCQLLPPKICSHSPKPLMLTTNPILLPSKFAIPFFEGMLSQFLTTTLL